MYLLGAQDCEYYYMSLKNLKAVNKLLKPMYTKKGWDEDMSIWSYKEIKYAYRKDLKYAKKIYKWLKTKPKGSYEIYFYDSYQERVL